MKTTLMALTAVAVLAMTSAAQENEDAYKQAMDKLGWRLSMSWYSVKSVPLLECIDIAADMGIHYIETGSFGPIDHAPEPKKLTPQTSPEDRQRIKDKLAERGVRMVSYYGNAGKAMFDFARDMGFEMLVGEPPEAEWESVDKLTAEYGIKYAFHNHPKPRSHYWDPATVVQVCENRNPLMGACGDTGHWKRSELEPSECVKLLGERNLALHLKDLQGKRDCPWGQGECNVEEILRQLKNSGAKNPVITIEYEGRGGSKEGLPAIRESVDFFKRTVVKLAGE